MRIHLLAIPNCPTTAAFYLDGFCQRTRLFAALLKALGHTVVLYGAEATDAPCDEFVPCVTADERKAFLGDTPYQSVPFDGATPLFLTFNTRAGQEIKWRKQHGDLIATIGGSAQMFVSEQHPELKFIEYSIGYRGVCAPYRVYQSHAWRHVVSGFTGIDGGRIFDDVIPPWYDAADFPFVEEPDDYVLYCGRVVESKGIAQVCDMAQTAGVRLLVAGFGKRELVTYGEFVGDVSTEARNRLMANARAVLMPTQYLEPFGNVAAEAQLCGTPVLSTDYGAFTESVEQGVSGYRCKSLGEFVQAIDAAPRLDRARVRSRAVARWDMPAAMASYRSYFTRLEAVSGAGWRDLSPTLPFRESYGVERRTDRLVSAGPRQRPDYDSGAEWASVADAAAATA